MLELIESAFEDYGHPDAKDLRLPWTVALATIA